MEKFDLNNVEFDKCELDTLKEVIFNALNKFDLSDDEAISYWKMLPDEIKFDVCRYGINDTPTMDKMYLWLINNCT